MYPISENETYNSFISKALLMQLQNIKYQLILSKISSLEIDSNYLTTGVFKRADTFMKM